MAGGTPSATEQGAPESRWIARLEAREGQCHSIATLPGRTLTPPRTTRSSPAFPSARARVWGRLLRGEAGSHHLKKRVPRIPEVLGFPEVPDWLTEPRLAGPLQLERFCPPA
ncbi:unnamed protein product [Rangifer tarandus platyrhynchus]|uniref:Uncharacterized protein n=1 Tax=Rangifer tarandus platyrhynchus TaxID=3082113 RepID=A0AC59YXZ8_RANTA